MSLRILFADDSMTAQNMGKKILTDAGYEVVAVSNGAAAVKKIAEQKPDIIILDIYMPGYTGLEVCDKVRTSTDTLRTPVLLTVGKMEPYKPEDANRVRADGVIIKPFEASDLLAVIKKLEERVVPKRTQVGEETVLLERRPDFAEFPMPAPENHRDVHAESSENTVPSTVDVPDNMASTAAFGDLLGTDLGRAPLPNEPFSSQSAISPETPIESAPPPTLDDRLAAFSRAEEKADDLDAIAVADTRSATAPVETISLVPDTEPLSVYREPQPAIAEVHATPEPEAAVAQESSFTNPEENPSVAAPQSFIDRGLAIHVASFEPFTTRVESEVERIEATVSASETRQQEADLTNAVSDNGFELPATATSSDLDFEARVAAAMSIYDQPLEGDSERGPTPTATETAHEPEPAEPPASFEYSPPVNAFSAETPVAPLATAKAEPAASDTMQPVEERPVPVVPVVDTTVPVEDAPIEAEPMVVTSEATQVIPVFLDSPVATEQAESIHETPMSATPTFVSTEATQEIPVYLEPHTERAQEEVAPVGPAPSTVPEETSHVVEEKAAASIQAELPAIEAAATAFTGVDTVMISAVVDRILDRLKPQLIEEISRELKTKKK